MSKHIYSALVTESHTYPVQVEVEVPDGRSPWGPAGREGANEAALRALAVARYEGVQPQVSTRVQLTSSRPETE